MTTSERALEILRPSPQGYTRFLAARNLAHYHFVDGQVVETLDLLTEEIGAARRAFRDDPEVPLRAAPLLAKALMFGGAVDRAAITLGHAAGACSREQLWDALRGLEHPRERAARQRIWDALSELEAEERPLPTARVEAFLALYAQQRPFFFDALDRWVLSERLARVVDLGELDGALAREHAELAETRREVAVALTASRATTLSELSGYLHEAAKKPAPCNSSVAGD